MHASLMLFFALWACQPESAPPPPPGPPLSGAPDALEARRRAMSEELRGLVDELEAAGRYDCCIKHACKLCAMRAGGCRCGEAARSGEPVCEECAEMWMKGQGDEPVDKATIRSFLEAEHMANGDYGQICGKPEAPTP